MRHVRHPLMKRALITGALALAATMLSAPRAARADDDAATEPTREQVIQELQALREQVHQLEEKQAARNAKLDPKEVDATVDAVLRDAESRSQLMHMQGFTAGWDNGKFLIQSEDKSFVLSPQFWMQLRYVENYREEDADNEIDGDATNESGLELRRMKLIFDGNAFGPDLKYRFMFNTNRTNGNAFLEDAYVTYKLNDWLRIKGGQYKEPTFHEEVMADVRQLAAERSLVNFTLGGANIDRVQGVALIYDKGPDHPFRAEAGFTDGPNSKNTNFVDGGGAAFFGVGGPDFGLYGRGEYKVMGDWKNYEDFTSLGTNNSLLVVGGGMSYAQAGDNDALFHTVDAQYECGPVSAYLAYLGVYSESEDNGSLYDAGILAQASYMLNKKWEVFGRYEYINLDNARGGNFDDDYHVIAAGVNYYMSKSHAAKFTVDLSYLPNGTPVNADALGILDPDADGDQFVLRGQFQLLL